MLRAAGQLETEHLFLVTGCVAHAIVSYDPWPAQPACSLDAASLALPGTGSDAETHQPQENATSGFVLPMQTLWPEPSRQSLSLTLAALTATLMLHCLLVAVMCRRRCVPNQHDIKQEDLGLSRSMAGSSVMRSRCTHVHYDAPGHTGSVLPAALPEEAGTLGGQSKLGNVKAEPASSLHISLDTLATGNPEMISLADKPGPVRSSMPRSQLVMSGLHQGASASPWQRKAGGGRLARQSSGVTSHVTVS